MEKARFVQSVIMTSTFLEQAKRCGLTEAELMTVCATVAGDPRGGALMAGTGGARKMRHAGRDRGKSGGFRTVHYWGGDDIPVFLLAIYGKGTKATLSGAEKRALAKLLSTLGDAYPDGVQGRLRGPS